MATLSTVFIDKTKDFKGILTTRVLEKLNNEYNTELVNAERFAISAVTDATASRYDIAAELLKSGTTRNNTLVRWLATLAAYHLYGSVADVEVPERIIKNYDDVREELRLVNQGKMSVQLSRVQVDGESVTKFMAGSDTRRSQNPY